jgi:hypothetical protein
MKSAKIIKLTILVMVLALYICGSAIAANPKDKTKKAPKDKPAIKLPVLKDVKFTEEDQNFFVWLNKFFPETTADLKSIEKDTKEYHKRFTANKKRHMRLWKSYKHNPKLGKPLVVQRKLRLKRNSILQKLKLAKDNKSKDKLRSELNIVVAKEFDSAVEIKKIRYEGLRARIKWMEKELAKRQEEVKKLIEHKNKEVNKRVEALENGEEKINWN